MRRHRLRALRLVQVLVLGLLSQTAFGHAGLVSSEPGRRATLTVAPKEIRVCFNEDIEAKYSKLTLEDTGGTAIPLGALHVAPDHAACLIASVPKLANGAYTVKYHVLSVDGHVVDYGYGFRLNEP